METKKEEAIQIELAKLVEPWVNVSGNENRNELLYNFFITLFQQSLFPFRKLPQKSNKDNFLSTENIKQ